MKATKRPVTVDYYPIKKEDLLSSKYIQQWMDEFDEKFKEWFHFDGPFLYCTTLEGNSYSLTIDDVIIRGVDGEYHPCKKNIFEKTYDTTHNDSSI